MHNSDEVVLNLHFLDLIVLFDGDGEPERQYCNRYLDSNSDGHKEDDVSEEDQKNDHNHQEYGLYYGVSQRQVVPFLENCYQTDDRDRDHHYYERDVHCEQMCQTYCRFQVLRNTLIMDLVSLFVL